MLRKLKDVHMLRRVATAFSLPCTGTGAALYSELTANGLPMHCRGLASDSGNRSLFVGGLSWEANEKTLKQTFSVYGEVTEVRIIYDRDSGRSRGFGFVTFSNEEGAKSAKVEMDGKEFLGRPLRINYAIERVSMLKPRMAPRLSPLDSEFDRTLNGENHNSFRDWNSGQRL